MIPDSLQGQGECEEGEELVLEQTLHKLSKGSLGDLLVVHNWLDGEGNLAILQVIELSLEGSLSVDDKRGLVGDVDRQTSLSSNDAIHAIQVNDLHKVLGKNMLPLLSLNNVPGDLLQKLLNHPVVKGVDPLESHNLDSDMSLRLPGPSALHMDNVLDEVLLGSHALLLLLGLQGKVCLIHLVNNVLSTLKVDGSLKVLGGMRLGDNLVLDEDVLGEGRLCTGHILQLEVDSSLEVVKELSNHGIVAHLDSSVGGLGQLEGLLSLLSHKVVKMMVGRQLSQSLQSGGDVGSNLPAWLEPGADSQGVEVGSMGPGVGEHSDGSHTDLLSLSLIDSKGKDDRSVESGVGSSNLEQLVHSHRAGGQHG